MTTIRLGKRALLGAALLFVIATVVQANVLYSDGPVNGTYNGALIGVGSQTQVEDSFTLGSSSTIAGANFGSWFASGDFGLSVEWSIVGSEGSQIPVCAACTGTASLTGTFLFTNAFGFDVYDDAFSIPDVMLGAGTYWLELQNEDTFFDAITGLPIFPALWDLNGGPSSVWNSLLGDQTGANCSAPSGPGTCSNSFEIVGVPEPATLALLSGGLLGLTLSRRRRDRT